MVTWWVIILSTLLLGKYINTRGTYYCVNNVTLQRGSKTAYWLAVGILIFFAGLRSTAGEGVMSIGDTRIYNALFNTVAKENIFAFFKSTDFEGDWGFYALISLFRGVFHANNQTLFFICSLITMICLFYRYDKLDLTDKETLFFLFITFGMYNSTMNGIRQWLAGAILFLIFPLIKERRWKLYFSIVILTSLIHSSALIFLPLYFIADCRAWGKATKGIIVGAIFLLISYPVTGKYISLLLADSNNFSQYTDVVLSKGGSANIIRIAVYILPLLFAYYYREKMEYEPYYNIIINFSVLSVTFMVLASTNWIYARFCIYLDPFLLIVYSWVLKYCFKESSKELARILFYGVFLVYYWYQMYIGFGGQIYTSQVLGIGW